MTPEEQAREIAAKIVGDIFWRPGRSPSNRERRLAVAVAAALAERDREIQSLKIEHIALARAEGAVMDARDIPGGNVEQAVRTLTEQRDVLRARWDALVGALEDVLGELDRLKGAFANGFEASVKPPNLAVIEAGIAALAAGRGEAG